MHTPHLPMLNETKRVLLSLFGRFGAICQALTIAREISRQHAHIEWLLICSPQLLPYCNAVLPNATDIRSVGRNDPIGLFRANKAIKSFAPQLGLNPWGHGIDSEYFASQAAVYHQFNRFWREYHADSATTGDTNKGNFHNLLRSYFGATQVTASRNLATNFPQAKQIMVCPESSEAKRTLSPDLAGTLLQRIREKYGSDCQIWLAASDDRYRLLDGVATFIPLKKSQRSSINFIRAINQSELVLAVDSGPMNIATALAIPTIAIFSSEAPERVIDFATPPLVLREASMSGKSCQNRQCRDPQCMSHMIRSTKLFEPENIWHPSKTITTSEIGCIWKIADTPTDSGEYREISKNA